MYSVQIAVSDGTLTRISLSIEYFEKDDITLYRNLGTTPLVLGTDWQWDGDTTINLLTDTPVPDGEYITVRRNTNIDRAFNIYDGGAAFSRDTLDENFKQMIYLAQEFTEGNGLTGLYFPLDMHGFKIVNLGDGTDPGDAVNKGQLDVVDSRVAAIENTFVSSTTSYPWHRLTTVDGEDTFSPPFVFDKAALYINGACQTPDYSFIVVNNQILVASPLPAGTMVFARLGEDVQDSDGFVTSTQFSAYVTATDGRLDTLESDVSGKLSKAANLSDVADVATARTNLGLGNSSTLNVGTTVGTVAAGDDTRIVGAAQKASNLSDLDSISAARTNLGLGDSATRNTGTTSGTVLSGDAVGRKLRTQVFTTNGTYTPTAGMATAIVEVVGGGGAGGGTPITAAATVAAGCGGNAGAWFKGVVTAADVGAGVAVTVGAGGTGVAGGTGGGGGTSSLGTLLVCPGGSGGASSGTVTASSGATFIPPSARASATASTITPLGWKSTTQADPAVITTTTVMPSNGADSQLGAGGERAQNAAGVGSTNGYGGGGGGAGAPVNTAAARAGGAGKGGVVIIHEYS